MAINQDLKFSVNGYRCDFAQLNTKALPDVTKSTSKIFASLDCPLPLSLGNLKNEIIDIKHLYKKLTDAKQHPVRDKLFCALRAIGVAACLGLLALGILGIVLSGGVLPIGLAIPVALAMSLGSMGYFWGGAVNLAFCLCAKAGSFRSVPDSVAAIAPILSIIPGLTLPFIFAPIYEAANKIRWIEEELKERRNGLELESSQRFLANQEIEKKIQGKISKFEHSSKDAPKEVKETLAKGKKEYEEALMLFQVYKKIFVKEN